MEENQLSSEEAQNLWDEEASKLGADSDVSATEQFAAAPETPQEPEPQQAQLEPEQPEDPLAGLSPAVRAKLAQIDELAQANAQLLHHVKTTEGRVAAMQREAQQARQAATQVAPQDAPTQVAIVSAAKNPEKWEQLKQDFPEWADAMEEYVASKLGAPSQQQNLSPEAVAQFVQQEVANTRAEMGRLMEEARIEGKYENWRETINTTEFAQWYSVQAPETRALADSAAARDAIKMLDLFSAAQSRSAGDIKQERGARLAAAATTRTGQTPPPKTIGDMSPAELWNYEAKKRERQLAERGY
ncbi:hypothetical protein UFOVP715_70 [uncultured Caudovirales phage]|uniref:Scaffolding protein n=1 Tax=uncultured Caudovirales phage TaxID=2100421 RepID=A0A6J5NLS8_9CAUD|nr:hypothetical protein UFOVP715_70 [uncultured Caudovirales phage]